MKRLVWRFFWWLLLALPVRAGAQALVGDGLRGDYYDGRNFETHLLTRRDATIDFNWHQGSPASGLAAEEFSVRWTGWLVPPATGRYVLHVSVDDGMRLWLNSRLLLNEWRGQSLSKYQIAIYLKAGEAYALRVDYCQYAWDSRALLTWERPDVRPAASSWRNVWGAVDNTPPPEALPTRYLFSHNPKPSAVKLPALTVAATRPVVPAQRASLPKLVARQPATATMAPVRRPVVAPARRVVARPSAGAHDSLRAAAVATRLAEGQTVTLRALYFEQGKADLLPAVQASLDTLATALVQRPSLRLEVQGHTDNQGDSTLNRQLSQRRAEAVCQYLAAHGVAATRLRPVGYGGRLPVADNRQPAQRSRNRRVVLIRQ